MSKFVSNLASRSDMKMSMAIGVAVGVVLTLQVQKRMANRPVRAEFVN
jgi:hypothetical protein